MTINPGDHSHQKNRGRKVTVSWSGGKDSAFALYKILLSGEFEVINLHTVINEESKRVGMHGIREELIDRQAESLGIPLEKIYLEKSETHIAYEKRMRVFYSQCAKKGIEAAVFGDIFLTDLKKFREELIKPSGVQPLFPLWRLDSRILVEDFINTGFKTMLCSANALYFNEKQMGQAIDYPFLNSLPSDVDPCGENGEFHTFVYDGPIFKKPVGFTLNEVVTKNYSYQAQQANGTIQNFNAAFLFIDIIPA